MVLTHVQGTLKFQPGEYEKLISIPIVDDDMSEPDVVFHVTLSITEGSAGKVALAQQSVPVTIVDDDNSGQLMFELPTHDVRRLGACM